VKYINVRGCNGSGKTTLLRMLARGPEVRVEHIEVSHNVKGVGRVPHSPIPVTFTPEGLAILGNYTSGETGTTAGCDKIRTQEAAKAALEKIADCWPECKAIMFEGIVVSTIFGPWLEWEKANGGMVWAFLDTPLDVCLKRIQDRNGVQPIKEDQVADKHRTIARVRDKVLEAYPQGGRVYDIRWEKALSDIKALVGLIAQHRNAEFLK
jgi:energy-coupling factor transporter ATP-binding protein EcfA2